MPELPEVETVRKSLEQILFRRTIVCAEVLLPRIVRTPEPAEFCRRLSGRAVSAVRRRGKYLLIDLGEDILVSHLRMEGRYGLHAPGEPRALHTHVVFRLDGGQELRYRDVRQFGTMDLLSAAAAAEWDRLRELAPEPLDPGFDACYLRRRLQNRRAPIKAALLDQTVVAGLGNIYADEILFRAGIHPERAAGGLRPAELSALADAARDIIAAAIEQGGSSIKSYVHGFGAPGGFQFSLRVYGRAGQPCVACGSPVVKGRVGGRGTHVCVRCQRPPRLAAIRADGTGAAKGAGRSGRADGTGPASKGAGGSGREARA